MHRQEILRRAISYYNGPLIAMRHDMSGMSKEERKAAYRALREKQGPVLEFVTKFLTDPNNLHLLSEVKAEFPSLSGSGLALEKRDVAHIIFPDSWSLLGSMHDFYKETAPKVIEDYMALHLDDEESVYSANSVYIDSKQSDFDAEFWYYLSNFAYLDAMVPDEDISAIYSLEDRKPTLIYKRDIPAKRKAFHGSCNGRVGKAISALVEIL